MGISYGDALAALKEGKRVAREGWNGKGMWLVLVPTGSYDVACGVLRYDPYSEESRSMRLLPWIGMKTVDNCFVPWLCSQTDGLADDWLILED